MAKKTVSSEEESKYETHIWPYFLSWGLRSGRLSHSAGPRGELRPHGRGCTLHLGVQRWSCDCRGTTSVSLWAHFGSHQLIWEWIREPHKAETGAVLGSSRQSPTTAHATCLRFFQATIFSDWWKISCTLSLKMGVYITESLENGSLQDKTFS